VPAEAAGLLSSPPRQGRRSCVKAGTLPYFTEEEEENKMSLPDEDNPCRLPDAYLPAQAERVQNTIDQSHLSDPFDDPDGDNWLDFDNDPGHGGILGSSSEIFPEPPVSDVQNADASDSARPRATPEPKRVSRVLTTSKPG